MYLISAAAFDAEWQYPFAKSQISQGNFVSSDGGKQTADFIKSEVNRCLDDGKATGFMKPYFNMKYSFVALLPNENISMDQYIQSLTGEKFLNIIKGAQSEVVDFSLPKFQCSCLINLNGALSALGMPDAFTENADFGKMTKTGGIRIREVLQNTFISVDENGTKAGAATQANMYCSIDTKTVNLNRPFVYAIVDNATDLPGFYRNRGAYFLAVFEFWF